MKGKQFIYHNLAWLYKTDVNGLTSYISKFQNHNRTKRQKIFSLSKDKEIQKFESIHNAVKYYNLPDSARMDIRSAIENNKEFNELMWFYQ